MSHAKKIATIDKDCGACVSTCPLQALSMYKRMFTTVEQKNVSVVVNVLLLVPQE